MVRTLHGDERRLGGWPQSTMRNEAWSCADPTSTAPRFYEERGETKRL
jgi:hypothetical protein